MDVYLSEATSCMPLYRDELFHDVVCKKTYGNISQVWHLPGHIVLTTNDSRKLFTFDCIPVALQQNFDQKFLDIRNLQSPLLSCLMLTEDIIALVDKEGHVRLMRFSENCTWVPWGELDLCQSNSAEVVSVSWIKSVHQLVWCERRHSPAFLSSQQTSRYCVCRGQLPANFNSSKVSGPCQSSILLHNVLSCDVDAISPEALFISLKHDENKVSVYMIFDFVEDVMTLYVGDRFITAEINDGIDFQEAALMCLTSLALMEPGQGDCGVRVDEAEGHAVVLSSSGTVEILAFSKDNGKRQRSKRKVQLSKCDVNFASAHETLWFLHKQMLGIVSGKTVSLYSLKDGAKLCEAEFDEEFKAVTVVPSRSPVFLAWILTPDQLYGLQGKDLSTKEVFTTPDKLPSDELLQTEILRLARLQEKKSEGFNIELSQELLKLKEKWNSSGGLHQQSEVAQILDTVDHNQLRQWQSLIGLDGGDLLNFEFVCRLLFHLEPAKVLQFAKCAEYVSEQAVGVSAFVRKKHSLIYYKAACECLPDCQTSTNPKLAAAAKAKLILASQCDSHEEKALKCYLRHGLWTEAVELLREVDTDDREVRERLKNSKHSAEESLLPTLLHITVTCLAQNQVLSNYVTDLFELMPNWKSFLSFSKVATDRPGIRQQQLSTSVHDVFVVDGSNGVPLESDDGLTSSPHRTNQSLDCLLRYVVPLFMQCSLKLEKSLWLRLSHSNAAIKQVP
ncbi:ATP-dependent RNA helicase DBP2 [Elysia marginata]|uniref:ATP-dependent RNA helicase DBP2 n=1 Tax=Elysia marginata TaxID=1093978 RepID=A0AAV4GHV9_9GAST|nr:ATP-dependent RNA helicase DBP2 [Elysia marginata]